MSIVLLPGHAYGAVYGMDLPAVRLEIRSVRQYETDGRKLQLLVCAGKINLPDRPGYGKDGGKIDQPLPKLLGAKAS
jgi:hypothetical protein